MFPDAVCDGTGAAEFVSIDDDVATTGGLADEDIVADLAREDHANDRSCEDLTSSNPLSCSNALTR